jgi:hypothetical protein
MGATSRGPTARNLDERVDDLGSDVHEVLSDVAGLRVDVAGLRAEMAARSGKLRGELGEFGGEIRTELGGVKSLGIFFAGVLVAVALGFAYAAWDAGSIAADVEQQGRTLDTLASDAKRQCERLEKVEKRLDGIDAKLDILIRRAEPKAKGE